jgi:hypothetical protein
MTKHRTPPGPGISLAYEAPPRESRTPHDDMSETRDAKNRKRMK